MWSQICNKHGKDLCPFTYQKIEAQKKKRNEAQKSRTLTSKQSITKDDNKDHSRKGMSFIKHISSIIGNTHGIQESVIYKYWMKKIQVVFQQSIANAIISRSYTIRKRYNGLDYTCQLPYIMQDSYRIYSSNFNCSDRLD